jgi:hypothetical protein
MPFSHIAKSPERSPQKSSPSSPKEYAYIAGLDLGQQTDPSVLAVAQVHSTPKRFDVRHLSRWPLATSYPAIINDIVKLYSKPPLIGSILVLDATGVGRPVLDHLRERKIDARIIPVVLTAGYQTTHGKGYVGCPKFDLVAALRMVLGQSRLRISTKLPLAAIAQRELENFTLKVSEKGLEQYGNENSSTHDDCVIALGLLSWYGDRYRTTYGLKTLTFSPRSTKGKTIVITSQDTIQDLPDDGFPAVVLNIFDQPQDPVLPEMKLLGWHQMHFQDAEPAQHEGQWTEELSSSFLSPEQSKALWLWLLQPQWSNAGTPWKTLIISDTGGEDRRALSVGMAIAANLNILPSNIILHDEDNSNLEEDAEPPNRFVYGLIRRGRTWVCV